MKHKLIDVVNAAGRLSGAGRLNWFDVARLVRKAKEKADFDSFEDPRTVEGISELFHAYDHDGQLSLVGKVALSRDALTTLTNRLIIEKQRMRTPDIARQTIEKPIVVLGLPRTGTTLLHNLLTQDPQNRGPLGWEIMYPYKRNTAREREALIDASAKRMAWIEWLSPKIQHIHEVNPRLPQECIAITSYTFESFLFETMCRIPSYQRWLAKRDLVASYEFHRRFLQHLQYGEECRAWVIKAPTHLFAVKALLTVYPDAHIVQTHREPTTALASLASLILALRQAFSTHQDQVAIGEEMLERWSKAVETAMEHRDALSTGSHVWQDLSYRDLTEDPVASIEHLYDGFGRSLSGVAADRMRTFLASSPKGKFGTHRYSLEDFEIDERQVRERFQRYYRRFHTYM